MSDDEDIITTSWSPSAPSVADADEQPVNIPENHEKVHEEEIAQEPSPALVADVEHSVLPPQTAPEPTQPPVTPVAPYVYYPTPKTSEIAPQPLSTVSVLMQPVDDDSEEEKDWVIVDSEDYEHIPITPQKKQTKLGQENLSWGNFVASGT
jgi:hypothetical protein